MILIFMFSNSPGIESNNNSTKTINKAISVTLDKTNELGITDKHPSANKMNRVVGLLNTPLRKCMHAGIYLVLAILIVNAIYVSNINGKYIIAIIICFIYACTDEFHQTYIIGRTGQFSDVLIDTTGAIIGIGIYALFNKLIRILKKN